MLVVDNQSDGSVNTKLTVKHVSLLRVSRTMARRIHVVISGEVSAQICEASGKNQESLGKDKSSRMKIFNFTIYCFDVVYSSCCVLWKDS